MGKDKAVSYYGFLDLVPHAFNVATSKYDPINHTEGDQSGLSDAAPQLRLKGKRAVSNDEKTHYIKLSVFPSSKRIVDDNEEKDVFAF